jgi:hypothetical protein
VSPNLCSQLSAHSSLLSALCSQLSALCSQLSALCSQLSALCSLTMATSQLIHPDVFTSLTEGQVLTWRQQTYGNLTARVNYTRANMLSLDKSPVMSLERIKDSIKDRLIMYKSTGQLSTTAESVFVMIDSCVLGVHALPSILSRLRKEHKLERKNLVLVVSHINMTENNYKIAHQSKYPCINFKRLIYNMKFLEGKEAFRMRNVVILKTDLVFDNKILFGEEHEFLRLYGRWEPKDRNEINDNAQLEMLIQLNDMFSNKCFMISRDNGLLDKTAKAKRSIRDLHAYRYF